MSNHPEHDKLSDGYFAVGEFINWLLEHDREIGEWTSRAGIPRAEFTPIGGHHAELQAEFFGIDRKRLAAERERMLVDVRAMNAEVRDE